jgi:recombination protein RecA
MAKKKDSEDGESKQKGLDKDLEALIKGADALFDNPPKVFSVTPSLDAELSGGIPEGSVVVISGKPKLGKTSLALSFACQTGRKIVYADVEHRLKAMNLNCHKHFDPSKFRWIRSDDNKIASCEDYLTILDRILHDEKELVMIIDSFSFLATNSELTEGIDKSQRADANKIVSKFLRKNLAVIKVKKHILIGMTHIIANVSGYGAPTMEKTSNAIKYMVDVKLIAKKTDDWTASSETRPIGHIITFEVETSALGPPGGEALIYHRFGHGLDIVYESFSTAIELGLIKQAGSWFKLLFLPEYTDENPIQFQGGEKAYQALVANPEWLALLQTKLKEMLS